MNGVAGKGFRALVGVYGDGGRTLEPMTGAPGVASPYAAIVGGVVGARL